MKQLVYLLFGIFLLMLPTSVFAAGGGANESIVDKFLNGNQGVQKDLPEKVENNQRGGMEKGYGTEGENGEDEGHAHSEDEGEEHTHDYEEPGANIPLLSAFGAINGGFILFGAVRKFKRKRKNGVN